MFDLPSFIEANQHPSIATDSTGRILSLNGGSARMLDLDKSEWEGRNITTLLPAVHEVFIPRPRTSDSIYIIQKPGNAEGISFPVGIRVFALQHEKETYFWFMLDRQEETELEVDKIKERYQLAVEAGHTGIWDYSFDDNQLIADDSLKNLLGYKGEEMIDNDFFWERMIAEEDRDELKHAIEANIRQGKSYFEETFRMIHRHRVLLWVLGRGKIFYRKNEPYRIICSVTDITDRREASEQLRKTLINFKAIFDAFPDLFFRVDRIGDFLEIMAGEYADFGIPNITDYEGRNIREAFPESEYLKLYDCLQLTFDSRSVEKCEYKLKVNGRKRYYEARMIAITGDEAIGIVRDITEAVKINKELFSAKRTAEEALNARDSFFSMMSHEMRTPLNVVIGMIYLLLEQDPRADQLKFIHTMKFSADSLLSLINDLLDFSKIKAGKIVFERSEFNLREIIQNIYNSYKLQMDSSKVDVFLEIDDSLPVLVQGDSKRLSQILNNLLSNAQKFTASGEIRISVRQEKETADSHWIEFQIRDSGIGIPEKRIKDIFKPYEQAEPDTSRKYGGTGLGLTIVKQLVELQNGTLGVKSSTGAGSIFTVILPFGRQKIMTDAEQEKKKIGEGIRKISSLDLLYADDVNSNLFLMKGYADLWKFRLDTANDGEQALELFREKTYDLFLHDLQMTGKDGFETAREMREIENSKGVHTPIIAVTGDISDETVKQIYLAGMDDYLYKPVNPKVMLEKIGRWKHQASETGPTESSPPGIELADNHILQFQQVDYLYEEDPALYTEYLRLLEKEFKDNLALLRMALIEENYDEFRRVRHSMKSNMKLFKMYPLQALLDEIKEKFSLSQLPPGGGIYIDRLENMVSRILVILDSKMAVISG